jgi:hypothetical protein
MKNIKDYIEVKENVVKIKETSSKVQTTGPPRIQRKKTNEEEFNLEEEKEPDEFVLGDGGLDDFMTSLKEDKKKNVVAKQPVEVKKEQRIPETHTTNLPKAPANKPSLENDIEIQGFVQASNTKSMGVKPKPKGGNEEFDNLFGDSPKQKPVLEPSVPEIQPVPQYQAPPSVQPRPANDYAVFASYYQTYKQPAVRPAQPPMGNPAEPQNYQTRLEGQNKAGNQNDFWQ